MDRFLIKLNTFLIILGISAPLLLHLVLVPLAGDRGHGTHGAALGLFIMNLLVFTILTLSGGVVFFLSRSLIKKHPDQQRFRRQKYVGSAMVIVPLILLPFLFL